MGDQTHQCEICRTSFPNVLLDGKHIRPMGHHASELLRWNGRILTSAVDNRLTYENAARENSLRRHLEPAERELLLFLRDQLNRLDMLDVGVGAGRTAFFFSALVRNYTGLDYAKSMIQISRAQFGETERQKFLIADAASLPMFADHSFDLIMFSFNGIDCVTMDDRQKVLDEMRRLVRPSGYFFFSTHSLDYLPFSDPWPQLNYKRPLRFSEAVARQAIVNYKLWLRNRHIDINDAKQRGWAILHDRSHNFGCVYAHTTAKYQIAELTSHSFGVVKRFDAEGRTIDANGTPSTFYSHYLCRPL